MFSQLAIKIAIGIATRMFTETFVARMLVHGLQGAAAKTTNKVDDKMVQDVADALGVK